jgi:hypothetical protein
MSEPRVFHSEVDCLGFAVEDVVAAIASGKAIEHGFVRLEGSRTDLLNICGSPRYLACDGQKITLEWIAISTPTLDKFFPLVEEARVRIVGTVAYAKGPRVKDDNPKVLRVTDFVAHFRSKEPTDGVG